MSSRIKRPVEVTLILSPQEFETAVMFGEEALSILMDGGVIPPGEVSTSDPAILRDLATFGLQELIANWSCRKVRQSHAADADDEIPF